jgi:hypothetical protein
MQLKCLFFAILVSALITGCGGSDTSNHSGTSRLVASQSCMNLSCHGTMGARGTDQVTGALIADEWLASAHNTRNAAGCADCHEPDAQHPNQCYTCHGGVAVTRDADGAGKCYKCHGPAHPGDALMRLAPQHFGYSSASAPGSKRASYVSGQYQGRCRACHNPHLNNLTQQHRDYTKSKHGNPKGDAWNHYEFKRDDRAACIRCHTSTGFIAYVTSGFTAPTKGFGAGDPSRELLACDACHASYDFKNSIRQVPPFVGPYKSADGVNAPRFPDLAESNLCIPCHTGRESGQSLSTVADFRNQPFVNSHYMAAGATMYMSNAFIDYTTLGAKIPTNSEGSPLKFGAPTYARTLLPNSNTIVNKPAGLPVTVTPGITFGVYSGTVSTHRKLGTTAIRGDSHNPTVFVPGRFDTNGPCVVCHLNASGAPSGARPGSGHSLAIDQNAFVQVCEACHADAPHLDGGDGNGKAVYSKVDSFEAIAAKMIDPQKECFQNGLGLLKQILLTKYLIKFDDTVHPYFYDLKLDPTGKTPVTDWTRAAVAGVTDAAVAALGSATITPIPAGGLSQAQAKRLMGACFNLNLLDRDPGAFVHARTFTQRLVYDALDYLDNNTMDFTSLTTSRAMNPAIYHGTNVNVHANDGTLVTESMAWMSGTHYLDPTAGTTFLPGVADNTLKPMKLHP